MNAPEYEDDTHRGLGETLLAAYRAQESAPDEKDAYERARLAIRTGPLLRAGEILGHFRLLRHRYDGPSTATWTAEDLTNEEMVEITILDPRQASDKRAVSRFTERPAICSSGDPSFAQLVHPPSVYAGFHWFASEAAEVTLEEQVLDGSLTGPAALNAALSAGAILEQLHEDGVFHGNISPRAIRVADQVTLTDLGLNGNGVDLFAAPESADPAHEPSAANDVYGIALTLLFILSGKPLPFWVMRAPERLLDQVELPETPAARIRAALDWSPENRPSLSELLDALRTDAGLRRQMAEALIEHDPAAALAHYEVILTVDASADLRVGYAKALAGDEQTTQATATLMTALRAPDLTLVDQVIAQLRELAEATENWQPLAEALAFRAQGAEEDQDALLLEVARLRERDEDAEQCLDAWRAVLDVHTVRDQATEALGRLVHWSRSEGAFADVVSYGRRLAPYLSGMDHAALCADLGRTTLEDLHDPQNALPWLEQALESGGADPEISALIEGIRSSRGDWPELRELLLERAQEEDVTLLRKAARIAAHAEGNDDEADTIYRSILALVPDDPEALRALADREAAAGRVQEAVVHYGRLSDPDALYRSAELLALHDLGDAAVAKARQTLESAPGHTPARHLLAELLWARQEYEEAAPLLEQLVHDAADCPIHPSVRLGDLALMKGAAETAHGHFLNALRTQPDDAFACWGLARIALSGPYPEQSWLNATPATFTPMEALARLIDFLCSEDAVLEALSILSGAWAHSVSEASGLTRASALATVLCEEGHVEETLFSALNDAFPGRAGAIASVEALWSDPGASFPIAPSYTWATTSTFDPRRTRVILPVDGPQDTPLDPALLTALMVPSGRSVRKLDVRETVHPLPSLEKPYVLDCAGDIKPIGDHLVVGGGETDDWRMEGLDPARFTVLRAGEYHYVVASRPIEVDGAETLETRVTRAATLVVDGLLLQLRPSGDAPRKRRDNTEADTMIAAQPEPVENTIAVLCWGEAPYETRAPLLEPAVVLGPDSGSTVSIPQLPVHVTLTQQGKTYVMVSDDEPDIARTLSDGSTFTIGQTQFTLVWVPEDDIEGASTSGSDDKNARAAGIPTLFLHDGSSTGRPLPITKSDFTIGRSRKCDLKLGDDAQTSRHHATVIVRSDTVILRDNNSSNGTLVNDILVSSHALRDGDQVTIGSHEFTFRHAVPEPEDINLDGMMLAEKAPEEGHSDDERSEGGAVQETKAKIRTANEALGLIIRTLNQGESAGPGTSAVQGLVENMPDHFGGLFKGVEVRSEGLPRLTMVYNIAQQPKHRHLLSDALVELIDRSLARACDDLPEDVSEPMVLAVRQTHYWEKLRL